MWQYPDTKLLQISSFSEFRQVNKGIECSFTGYGRANGPWKQCIYPNYIIVNKKCHKKKSSW